MRKHHKLSAHLETGLRTVKGASIMDGRKCVALVVSLAVLLIAATAAYSQSPATATVGGTRMFGAQEVPVVLTAGQGRFSFRLQRGRLYWELSYSGLAGSITQAHIHLGQAGVNGAIALFLCSNLPNPPAGTQACPEAPASITGIADASHVLAIPAQGLAAGDFQALAAAMRAGATYANVHTTVFPPGEVRGQIPHDH
jgi:hypothetical protein